MDIVFEFTITLMLIVSQQYSTKRLSSKNKYFPIDGRIVCLLLKWPLINSHYLHLQPEEAAACFGKTPLDSETHTISITLWFKSIYVQSVFVCFVVQHIEYIIQQGTKRICPTAYTRQCYSIDDGSNGWTNS